ncbi:hypothetical protein MMC22_011011, partial [Lobaria immixta]|nr:hypothetical protein [Lobaria immixta]
MVPSFGAQPNIRTQSNIGTQPNMRTQPNTRPTLAGKGVMGFKGSTGGKVGSGGKGLGVGGMKRHRKVVRDSVRGITKGDIRTSISTKSDPQTNNRISSRSRLARRGGVKRLSTQIYDEVRTAMQDRLKLILKDCTVFLDHSKRK